MRTRSSTSAAIRSAALWLHRYVGLALSVFLVVSGLSGSAIAFYSELDEAVLASRFDVADTARGDATPIDAIDAAERVMAQLPEGSRVRYLFLDPPSRRLYGVSVAPGGDASPDADDEYFVDRRTGEVVGSRHWGNLDQGVVNLLPFMFELHASLALGSVGAVIFGVVGLLWTLDSFTGLYLTFPPPSRRGVSSGSPWLRRWGRAWIVKTAKLFSFLFSWHRASGLWVWGLLLIFAWSGVGLTLYEPVYRPTMDAALGMAPDPYDSLPDLDAPRAEPRLGLREAVTRAQALMEAEAETQGFIVHGSSAIGYYPSIGVYRYTAYTSLDVSDRLPRTRLWIDGDSGALLASHFPTGAHMGDTATTWLFALHLGALATGGDAYRVLVVLVGLLTAGLSVTGVWIWWRKRR